MKKAIYPGSFDPITNGHLDMIKRGTRLFDKIYVAVAQNIDKDPLFSQEERVELIKGCTQQFQNIEIEQFSGLVVDYANKVEASVILRGLRQVSDFDYEFQMALMNRQLDDNIDTVFLMPHEKYSYLSSSVVKEIKRFDGEISRFVPDNVLEALKSKLIKGDSNEFA